MLMAAMARRVHSSFQHKTRQLCTLKFFELHNRFYQLLSNNLVVFLKIQINFEFHPSCYVTSFDQSDFPKAPDDLFFESS